MNAYIHNLDPFAFQLSESFGIRWYGLAYLIGFVGGIFFVQFLHKKNKTPLTSEMTNDLVFYLALGVMLGGRLGYGLLYNPHLLTQFETLHLFGMKIPVWSALAIWSGGMASHGGIFGLIVACILFGKKHKINSLHLLDLTVFTATLGVFLGRIANFINGELYGRACENKCWWPVKFPTELHRWVSTEGYSNKLQELYPIVQSLGDISLGGGKTLRPESFQWKQWVEQSSYEVQVIVSKILEQINMGDMNLLQRLSEVLIARHPSQLYQAILEGLILSLITLWLWMKKKPLKPGMIACSAGLGYAIMRVVGEQWRMPDAHIGYQWLGLTRGQWFSLAMFMSIALVTVIIYKRPSKPLQTQRS